MKNAPKITKKEMKAYMKRWELVNEREREELRRTSMEKKLEQIDILMNSARQFGWGKKLSSEDKEVWQRWNLLREKYRRA